MKTINSFRERLKPYFRIALGLFALSIILNIISINLDTETIKMPIKIGMAEDVGDFLLGLTMFTSFWMIVLGLLSRKKNLLEWGAIIILIIPHIYIVLVIKQNMESWLNVFRMYMLMVSFGIIG